MNEHVPVEINHSKPNSILQVPSINNSVETRFRLKLELNARVSDPDANEGL